jgi:hypothetical protein
LTACSLATLRTSAPGRYLTNRTPKCPLKLKATSDRQKECCETDCSRSRNLTAAGRETARGFPGDNASGAAGDVSQRTAVTYRVVRHHSWDVTPCGLVEIGRSVGGTYCVRPVSQARHQLLLPWNSTRIHCVTPHSQP